MSSWRKNSPDCVSAGGVTSEADVRGREMLDHLGSDTHHLVGSACAPFLHVAHAELLAQAPRIHRLSFVGKDCIARYDQQAGRARQRRGYVLGEGITEITLG